MAASLVSLPNDIMRTVVEDLEVSDVCKLRSTCRSLSYAAVNKAFRGCFSRRSTDLSRKSLQDLASICAHSQYGPWVRQITVLVVSYDTNVLAKILATRQIQIREMTGSIFCVRTENCSEEDVAEAGRQLSRVEAWRNDQKDLLSGGQDVELLTTIFSHLAGRNTAVALHFEGAFYARDITTRLPASFSPHEDAVLQGMDLAFTSTMNAVSRARFAPAALHVFDHEWGGSVAIETVGEILLPHAWEPGYSLTSPVQPSKILLEKLTELKLLLAPPRHNKIDEPRDPDDTDETDEEDDPIAIKSLSVVAELLRRCPNLEILDLRFRGFPRRSKLDDTRKIFAHVAQLPCTTMSNLQRLVLHHIITVSSDLTSILQRCTNLTLLELRQVSVLATEQDGGWKPVFAYLAESRNLPKLECFNLDALYISNRKTLIRCTGPASALARSPKSQTTVHYAGARAVTFTGEECRQGIEYEPITHSPVSSPALAHWYAKLRSEHRLI